MELLKLVALLGARKFGNEYKARCPGHQETNPSFSFTEKNGKVVFKCFAGCNQEDLFKTIKEKYEAHYGKEEKQVFEKKEIKTKDYYYPTATNEAGFLARRIDYSDGSKAFRQLHLTGDVYSSGRGAVEVYPYKLYSWKDSPVVVFVEGEKCADALIELGIDATCIPGGVNGWRPEYAKHFAGKDVVIVPDNDTPGREFSHEVLCELAANANPFILELPNLENKEDVYDWIQKGGTEEEFYKLAKHAKKNSIIGAGFEDEFSDSGFIEKIQKNNSEKIIPFGVPFLDDAWGGILPTDLCVLSAKSGVGKTQMAMNITKNLLLRGKSVAFFALEAFNKEIGMRMIYSLAVDKYIKRKSSDQPYCSWADWVRGEPRIKLAMKPYVDEAVIEVKEKFGGKFFTHYLQKKFTIDDFEARFPMISKQSDLVVLDHLHYISRGKDAPAGHEFLSDVMGRMKNLVEEFRTPILLIAHVRKEDTADRKPVPDAEDLHGSSDIFKIGTKVAIIGKPLNTGYDPTNRRQETYIKIPKDRLGEIPEWMIGKMMFDISAQKYLDDYELIGLFKKKQGEWEERNVTAKPHWFGRSKRIQEEMWKNHF